MSFSQVVFELFILPVVSETTTWKNMIANIIYVKPNFVVGDKVKNEAEEVQKIDSQDLSKL